MNETDARRLPRAVRGAALFGAAGCALGGIAGTLDWPLVGTFFGGAEGGVVGAATGAVVAALAPIAVKSRWAVGCVSAAIAGLVAVAGLLAYDGPVQVPQAFAVAMVAASFLAGAWLGPMATSGVEMAKGPRQLEAVARLCRYVRRGSIAGASIGAMSGLVVGLEVYVPTAPFAMLEGSLFGAVSGMVLACLLTAGVVLARTRAHR